MWRWTILCCVVGCGSTSVMPGDEMAQPADLSVADSSSIDIASVADLSSRDSNLLDDALSADMTISNASVISLVAGASHSCVLLSGGAVKCWGDATYGQLGLGDLESRGDEPSEMGSSLPTISLGSGRSAKSLSAGIFHTCALLDDDTVKCWGYNGQGQLGQGDTDNRGNAANQMGDALLPVALGAGRTAKGIHAGGHHTCAILDDDSVKCWGYNNKGQLGLGDVSNRGIAANQMGNSLLAVALGSGRTAKSIGAGGFHTCALLDDNSVKCWGQNTTGQLGQGDQVDRGAGANQMGDALLSIDFGVARTVKRVRAGGFHTCAILDDNTLKCWGDGTYGKLGLDSATVIGISPNQMNDPLLAVSLGSGRTAKDVDASVNHTCAVLDDDSVKCWGNGANGKLGQGDTDDRGVMANQMGDALPSVLLGTGRTATRVAIGFDHSCALLDGTQVKCWGYGGSGALGQGDAFEIGVAPNQLGDALLVVSLE